METNDINNNLIKTYFFLLKNIGQDNKLELIARLSDSMKSKKGKSEYSLQSFLGGFIPEKDADELIKEIKEARIFYRRTEEF